MAIGDIVLDGARDADLLSGEAARAAEVADGILNGLFALGAGPRRALRARLSELLAAGSTECARRVLDGDFTGKVNVLIESL